MEDDESEQSTDANFCRLLKAELPKFDLVIVTDYGHGMFTKQAIKILCDESRCLAINTQANAANHGFNTVSKYPRADYICVSEKEMRLEASNSDGYQENRGGCREKAWLPESDDHGRPARNALLRAERKGLVKVPALVDHFADRVGAGDAVFAITRYVWQMRHPWMF